MYLGGNFFMTMGDPNDPMAVRCYRLDSKDEQVRQPASLKCAAVTTCKCCAFKNASKSGCEMIS